jgi:hypothetical protein
MENKFHKNLVRAISNLDYNEVLRSLKKGADSNFFVSNPHFDTLTDDEKWYCISPISVLIYRQKNYNLLYNLKNKNDINSEIKIAYLLLDYGANPTPALELANKLYGKFTPSNTRKSGFKKLWDILFHAQRIALKDYAMLPKTKLNELLYLATKNLAIKDMEELLKYGANPKYKNLKLNELLIDTVNDFLEVVSDFSEQEKKYYLERIENLLVLGANPNYKIPKKEYTDNVPYSHIPYDALRLLVFSIPNNRKFEQNRENEIEVAKILLKYGADAQNTIRFSEKLFGKYNPNAELDHGQKLLNTIVEMLKNKEKTGI